MRCQMCNGSESLQAHHRSYENHGREHLHLGDLICLCGKCHSKFHDKGERTNSPAPPPPALQPRPLPSPHLVERATKKFLKRAASSLGIPAIILAGMPVPDIQRMLSQQKVSKRMRRKARQEERRKARDAARREQLQAPKQASPQVKPPPPKPVHVYDHDADMPEGEQITMTPLRLRSLQTFKGGFTRATLDALGVAWPPQGGWAKAIYGSLVPRETFRKALEGRVRRNTASKAPAKS